ncbi:nicotinamide riboside transporter PnuC [Legionella lansingensis]|uniref:Nicotinamide riboside transporter PnuC n=1 Tax=Legionella lansingensis TaxID=45067 RepID=A0A0W0VXP5_9GAMM|nr:nicotinamide riboside transporter PnuC [Legionella lansingensis]KTD24803.1 Nicotinamide riboside transporter PnuC [Legionella lansingensis]
MFIDVLGAMISLLATYYFIRLNSKAWLISLMATSMNGWLYWQKGIYADTILESFYFLSACYGWYVWRMPTRQNNLLIIRLLSLKQSFLFIALTLVLFMFIAVLLSTFTDSNVVILDALTTSLSIVAQVLMCYKIILTWILWFITDAIYAYMYLHKQIPFHSMMMLVYLGMAIIGYCNWKKQYINEAVPVASSF